MPSIAVVVTSPPFSNLTATALNFIESALLQGTNIIGVFFYQDGVLNANKNIAIASDEFQASEQWQKLHQTYSLPLYLCYTAAEKRGMSDDSDTNNINEIFTVSGLGELVELSNIADRVVQL